MGITLEKEQSQEAYIPPLVITYHPALNSIFRIINKHFGILSETEDLAKVFSRGPLVSSRTAKTLRKELVRAKVNH